MVSSVTKARIGGGSMAVGVLSIIWGYLYPYIKNDLPAFVQSDVFNSVPVGWFAGLLCIAIGCIYFYDSQPIPTEVVDPPPSLMLTTDEPWRKLTSLRVLERLKASLKELEANVRALHQEALKAYQQLPKSNGMIEYNLNKKTLERNREAITEVRLKTIPELKARIERLFSGDVNHELLDFEEQQQKLKRERQELERLLREKEQEIKSADRNDTRQWLEHERQSLHQQIHTIDEALIEVESYIKELKNFDFKQLYKTLGLTGSANLAAAEIEHLKEFKERTEIIEQIAPKAAAATQPSADEQQFTSKRSKRSVDVRDKIFEDFELPMEEEVQRQKVYKQQRMKILGDPDLTPEDKDELLQRLEKRFSQQKKQTVISPYEED